MQYNIILLNITQSKDRFIEQLCSISSNMYRSYSKTPLIQPQMGHENLSVLTAEGDHINEVGLINGLDCFYLFAQGQNKLAI